MYTALLLCWTSVIGPDFISVPQCLFSFENGPGIETVSSAFEFLGHTPKIWDNNSALVQCVQSSGKHGGSIERMELFR
jgi:hypothetical protein